MTKKLVKKGDGWKFEDMDIDKLAYFLNNDDDGVGFVLLKGNILIEKLTWEFLRRLAERGAKNVPDERDSVYGRALQYYRTTGILNVKLLDSIERLNYLRNKYAHSYLTKVTRAEVDSLARPLANEEYGKDKSVREYLTSVILFVYFNLAMTAVLCTDSGWKEWMRAQLGE